MQDYISNILISASKQQQALYYKYSFFTETCEDLWLIIITNIMKLQKTILHSVRNHISPHSFKSHIYLSTHVFIQLQYAYESAELTLGTFTIQAHPKPNYFFSNLLKYSTWFYIKSHIFVTVTISIIINSASEQTIIKKNYRESEQPALHNLRSKMMPIDKLPNSSSLHQQIANN